MQCLAFENQLLQVSLLFGCPFWGFDAVWFHLIFIRVLDARKK
jgi:hypothetical protein